MSRFMLRSVLALVLVASFAGSAFAQGKSDARGDIGFGYSTLTDFGGGSSTSFPVGWVAAFAANVTPTVAAVGEISGNYKSIDVLGTTVSANVYGFQGGIRVRGAGAKATPFGQVLTGLGRVGASVAGVSGSSNAFSIQPGGGVDVKMTDSASVRGQLDYRFLHASGGHTNEFRFSFGVVFSIR